MADSLVVRWTTISSWKSLTYVLIQLDICDYYDKCYARGTSHSDFFSTYYISPLLWIKLHDIQYAEPNDIISYQPV
jgi:hypothetical protein